MKYKNNRNTKNQNKSANIHGNTLLDCNGMNCYITDFTCYRTFFRKIGRFKLIFMAYQTSRLYLLYGDIKTKEIIRHNYVIETNSTNKQTNIILYMSHMIASDGEYTKKLS